MIGNNEIIVIDVTDRLKCLDLDLEVQAFLVANKKTVSEPIELENGVIAVRLDAGLYLVVVTKGVNTPVGTTRTERSEGV